MAGSSLVQSLSRGLQLLELMASTKDGVSVQEAGQSLGVAPATAHNLLRTLVAHKFVVRKSNPIRYALGSAALNLAGSGCAVDISIKIDKALIALTEAIPQGDISYAKYIDGEICITRWVGSGSKEIRILQSPPLAPYGSASALLHQSFWTQQMTRKYRLLHPFSEYGSVICQSMDEVEKNCEAIRSLGFCCSQGHDGCLRGAAPIYDATGYLNGAIGCYIGADRINTDNLIETLHQALLDLLDDLNR